MQIYCKKYVYECFNENADRFKTKKTYYVKVRAYKYDSTKAKVYGSYRSVKAISIKK